MEWIDPPIEKDTNNSSPKIDLPKQFGSNGVLKFFYLTNLELFKAKNKDEADTIVKKILSKLNVEMAISFYTLPISYKHLTFVGAQGERELFDDIIMGNNRIRKKPQISINQKDYKDLPKEKKVEYLLSMFMNASNCNAGNWEEIYKTIELCGHLVGGRSNLKKCCPPECELKDLQSYANSFRHAVTDTSNKSFHLEEGKNLLAKIVRSALKHAK